jgi:co-chaperonin GroES (HSP10)
MIRKSFFILLLILLTTAGAVVNAQPGTPTGAAPAQTGDPNITLNAVIGEVKAIDAAAKQITVKTDAGSVVTASLSDSTTYLRVAPGAKDLTGAATITFADVAEGDRVMARGKVSDDKKTVPVKALIIMTKADIAKKQEAERAEWRRRGILGVVSAVNPASKEITITTRSIAGTAPVIIPVGEKVEMKRYAPDSIKFGDAKPSTLDELKVGDQLRALGERSPDGAKFTAEKIVSGSFRTVAGTVTAIDPATGEIKINDLEKKQPLTIVVKQDAVLRKFPAASEMMMFGGGAGRPAGGAGGQTQPAGGQAAPGGPGGGGMRPGGGGGPNLDAMLERLPTIALADVKTGDTIIVSSTKGADPSRLTAITLVSGADTLLNMIAARQQQAGGPATPNPAAGLGSGIQFGIGLP